MNTEEFNKDLEILDMALSRDRDSKFPEYYFSGFEISDELLKELKKFENLKI